LIELLVVIVIIGILALLLGTAILYGRRHAFSVSCQSNLQQMGTALLDLAQTNGGLYPNLLNAYPRPLPSDANQSAPNDSGFPWWARVYQELEPDPQGGLGRLFVKSDNGIYIPDPNIPVLPANRNSVDFDLNPMAHLLTSQLPPTFANLFHCRMAGALQTSAMGVINTNSYISGATNLFNSISYGINFDVKDSNGMQYCSMPNAVTPPIPYSPDFPNNLTPADKQPDPYYIAELTNPGAFILVSEAYTGELPPLGPPPSPPTFWTGASPPYGPDFPAPPYWTGSRISMGVIFRNASDSPPYSAPIVGRHDGRANVLYGDLHVASEQVVSGGTVTNNINVNTPLWTLSGN